jgi:arylsulfatase A-like enzyme
VVTAVLLVLAAGITVGLVVSRDGSAGPAHAAASGTPATTSDKPNIVLLLTDDQRWDELSRMPTVESQIVDKGVNFANGFVVDPLCCPSRTTILTGKYSHSTMIYRNVRSTAASPSSRRAPRSPRGSTAPAIAPR